MENTNDLNPENLVNNASFRAWVYHGKGDDFWQRQIAGDPNRRLAIEQARQILLTIQGEVDDQIEQEIDEELSKILARLNSSKQPNRIFAPGRWQMAAAGLVAAVALSFLIFLNYKSTPAENKFASSIIPNTEESKEVEISNHSNLQQLVNLPDGSSVILKKNSTISFPREFHSGTREVCLKGEAFFEVKKDPEHPFLVYAGEMVTRVVGTSFTIRAYETDETFSVKVRTGRVSVSALVDEKEESPQRIQKGIILEPDQAAILSRSNKVISLLSDSKAELEEQITIAPNLFEFRRTAVAEVFQTVSQAYNIKIDYDAEKMKNCTITASLGDEPLLDKLSIICEVLGATYHISDNLVQIESRGCKSAISL